MIDESYIVSKKDPKETEVAENNENLSCMECGKVEFCEAALIVHKRKNHSKENTEVVKTEEKKNISNRVKADRKRDFNHFQTYVSVQTGTSLNQILKGDDGKRNVQELFFGYFSNFRNQNGDIPSINYITKLRDSIKLTLANDYNLELSNREYFPEYYNRWQIVMSELYGIDKSCKRCKIQFNDSTDLKHHLEIHNGDANHRALASQTNNDRQLHINNFEKYVFDQAGKWTGDIVSSENGKSIIHEMFFGYFLSFRNQDGKIPSIGYIKNIRNSIKYKLLEEHKLDLASSEIHPGFYDRWKAVLSEIYGEFCCMKCGIKFNDRVALESHLETHNTEILLNKKELSNSGDKPHSCNKCDKSFTLAWKLRSHLKTHT